MEVFAEYLALIDNPEHRARLEEVLEWIIARFPDLKPIIAWNQPMFTDHGTYIIGFSAAKHHFAVAPERAGIERFTNEIAQAGYDFGTKFIRVPWGGPVDFSLLEKMIAYNISDKADTKTFWRKQQLWFQHIQVDKLC